MALNCVFVPEPARKWSSPLQAVWGTRPGRDSIKAATHMALRAFKGNRSQSGDCVQMRLIAVFFFFLERPSCFISHLRPPPHPTAAIFLSHSCCDDNNISEYIRSTSCGVFLFFLLGQTSTAVGSKYRQHPIIGSFISDTLAEVQWTSLPFFLSARFSDINLCIATTQKIINRFCFLSYTVITFQTSDVHVINDWL